MKSWGKQYAASVIDVVIDFNQCWEIFALDYLARSIGAHQLAPAIELITKFPEIENYFLQYKLVQSIVLRGYRLIDLVTNIKLPNKYNDSSCYYYARAMYLKRKQVVSYIHMYGPGYKRAPSRRNFPSLTSATISDLNGNLE